MIKYGTKPTQTQPLCKPEEKNLEGKYSWVKVFWSWDSAPPPVGEGKKYNIHSYKHRLINRSMNFEFQH